jgi:hypothetical protein
MKRILISSTLVTAAFALALIVLPTRANASSTPLRTFKAMRSALAAAVRSGELQLTASVSQGGVVDVSGLLDGKPLPPDVTLNVDTKRDGDTYYITVTADLSDANYSSISFGKDRSTLELVPKKAPNSRIEVALDPKTSKPKSWTAMKRENGAWKAGSHCEYNPKPGKAASPDDSTPIVAHITMRIENGGNAVAGVLKKG